MLVKPIPTTKLPSGEAVPVFGLGTWRMGESARTRKDEVAALMLGIELGVTLIDTAEMYGSGVAEEIVAEAVGGPARRNVHRQQGVAVEFEPQPHHRRLRAQPEAAAHRPHRPLSAALARQHAAGGDGRCFHRACRGREDPALGRQQFRPRRHGRFACAVARPRRGLRQQSGALQSHTARHRVRPHAAVPRARHADHGLLADRAGADVAQSRTRKGSEGGGRDAGAGCAGVAVAAGRRHRDPEGHEPRTSAGERRRARREIGRALRWPRWTAPSRRRRRREPLAML